MKQRGAPLVLVTGATGFIGSHVLPTLVGAGFRTAGVVRGKEALGRLDGKSVEPVQIDDVVSFVEEEKPAAVIHLATDYGRADTKKIQDNNIKWPLTIIEKLTPGTLFINTDTFFGKKEFAYQHMRPYIESKDEFWHAAKTQSHKEIKLLSLRLEHVFGENDSPEKFVPSLIRALLFSEGPINMTPGDQRRDFIYARDVSHAYLKALEFGLRNQTHAEEWQVGTGCAISVRDFAENVARISQKNPERLNFGALPHRPNEIMESRADNKGALKAGWQPRYPLQEAIELTLSKFQDNI